MSQKMIISWLENGIKDSLKIPIKRQMKALSDSARTTQAFLKIAKDEQELQEENVPERETTAPYIPYFSNTVSTTLKTPENIHPSESQHLHQTQTTNTREANNLYQQQKHFNVQQRSPPRIRHIPSQHHSFNLQSQSSTSRRNIQHIPTEHAASNNSSTMNMRQYGPCSICRRKNHRTIDCHHRKTFGCFRLAGTRDGGDSRNLQQNPSPHFNITSKLSSPIFINVQVNSKQQHAIIDTGSAVTIINQRLLRNIHHKKFIHKQKLHKSANSTAINIIGEVQLEVKIHGYKTLILADVATNLVTDLLLGTDWIIENNVIIDSPRRHIFLTDKYYRIVATTPFIEAPDLHLPILLTDEITLPPYSEKLINVKTTSSMNGTTDVLFEPAQNLYSKQILLTNAILKMEDNKSPIMIINANDRQRTLSKNTKLGHISYQTELNNYCILPVLSEDKNYQPTYSKSFNYKRNNTRKSGSCDPLFREKRKVQFTDFNCEPEQHLCYVCHEQFLSGNDLQQHLRQKCYPSIIREQIEQLTQHIQDEKQRQQLQNILWKHGKLFDLRQPSTIKATVRHAIETGTHSPVHTPPYRVSYRDEQIQREEIDKLLKQGIIEESTSPWSSPIVLVRKKDGSVRFCVDFRKLNNITTKDAFPMPRIEDIFDHLSQAEYYTTIDFKSGYFQVGLDPKDRPKTAFSTRDQHYQFTVLPQGVTNGPPAFQRIVSQILGPTRWQYSLAYLDDVIIYSPTFNQHLIHLDDILNRLNDANFRLNISKCQMARTSIDYLGHHIENSNIRPNADNIRALLETQQPATAKEAFRFVKAAEYYRKFIPGFSTIAQPLHQYAPTTKEQRSKKSQSTPITLSDDALDAFNKLKKILTDDLILRIPDKNLPFKIQTDASKIGIGAVLMQVHSNGDLPIAYLSKKFTTTQMNWPATEQECYAIIFAIEKWHKYLDGRPFIIETDHKPLLPFNMKQQLNSKCERWRLKLQQYQFTIRYIKGKHNTVADYLSRSPVDNGSNDEDDYTPTRSRETQTENFTATHVIAPVITRARAKQKVNGQIDCNSVDQTNDEQHRKRNDDIQADRSCHEQYHKRDDKIPFDHSCVAELKQPQIIDNDKDSNKISPFTLEQLKTMQHQDDETKYMISHIMDFNNYFLKDDMLMKKSSPPVPFVPKGQIRSDIIRIYHDTPANGAHFGRNRTTQKIKQRYFWPNMIEDIRNYVKSCIPCLQNNHRRQKPPGALKPIEPPEGVWQLLTMDFHGPLSPTTRNGNKYIISLTDVLSKFVITKAVRDCTATTTARFITEEVILKYGTPKCILTDNGTHFTASMMSELFKKIGVTHLYSTPYHPMTNGQIERYNATLDSKIAALSNEQRTDWDEQLPFVTFNYNTNIHTTTGQIPFELMYGRLPILPFDQQQPIVTLSQDPEHVNKLKQYLSSLTAHAKSSILKQQKKYKERYDRHRTNPVYKLDDLVLIQALTRRNKLDIRYEGPFRIVQQLGTKTFIVKHIKKPTLVRQVTSDVIRPLCERRKYY
ncbi:unnamed protein product [Rotaria magnacalcarata]|uniref:RNA-directed DNA polymerase n=4 Tax=Rotaria magnacalcarata TaxID=392030 RepID=A0A819ZHF8_9BILA|nr:unnamed protein product [Rotaria magnacalcarata]CAF4172523.1 unnamed protein product [Rotaria magnacalcarata]